MAAVSLVVLRPLCLRRALWPRQLRHEPCDRLPLAGHSHAPGVVLVQETDALAACGAWTRGHRRGEWAGEWAGAWVGAWVGTWMGAWVGACVGTWVGAWVGAWVGGRKMPVH